MDNRLSQEYYDHLNNGETYTCDKCQTAEVGPHEYEQYVRFQYHYCEPCWNYMHLKKGTCTCGNTMTNRSEQEKTSVLCSCGNEVVLTWQ